MTYKIFDTTYFMDDEEIREILEDAGAEVTEKNIELEREFINRANAEDFWDNVKAVDKEGYAVIADLGLWYGRRKAWAVTQTLHDITMMARTTTKSIGSRSIRKTSL